MRRSFAATGARAVKAVDAGRICDEDWAGAADEQATLNDPDDAPDALLQPRRIDDRTEAAMDNVVAAVGDERDARRRQPQPGAGAERLEGCLGWFQPEGDDLDRHRCARTQLIHQLRAVDDDGKAMACVRDDLLAQQCAAQPLDQIESAAFHLVRAVDREIDLPMLGERGERDARRRRLRRCSLRRGNADKAQTLPTPPRYSLDREIRLRAAAQS